MTFKKGQRELATIAWLRTGLDSDQVNIPRFSLLATCERVLRLRPEVSRAVAAKLRQVTSQEKLEQFKLLLLDQRSLRKLADTTLNDEEVVTADNAEQLLELMRRATAEEERLKHEEELKAERRKSRAKQDQLRTRQAETMAQRDQLLAQQRAELEVRDAQLAE